MCEHEDIEWGDDDERGECQACGATCDWHYERVFPYGKEEWERVPHEWHER